MSHLNKIIVSIILVIACVMGFFIANKHALFAVMIGGGWAILSIRKKGDNFSNYNIVIYLLCFMWLFFFRTLFL